jgi:hypothetical protein
VLGRAEEQQVDVVLDAADFFDDSVQVANDATGVGVKAIFDFGNNQALTLLGAEDEVVVQARIGVGLDAKLRGCRRSAAKSKIDSTDPQLTLWAQGLRRSAAGQLFERRQVRVASAERRKACPPAAQPSSGSFGSSSLR